MADFEAPSFSLGLDCDLFDREPQIDPVSQDRDSSSSKNLSVAFATFKDKDGEFEDLVVDDSEPEYPDSHRKLKRLRRGLTMGYASLSSAPSDSAKAELHSTAVIDDENIDVFTLQEDRGTEQHLRTQHHVVFASSNVTQNRAGDLTNQPVNRKQHLSNDEEPVSASCNDIAFTKLIIENPLRGFQWTDSDPESSDPYVSRRCIGLYANSNLVKHDLPQHVKRKQNDSNASEDFPKAYHYFFHHDPRIQELVRSRLPNFSPLCNMLNIDHEQPGESKIDYRGQFSFGESSKQAGRTNKDKKSSTSRKISRKSKTEETSQGWVNPKLDIGKMTTKGAVKRKAHTARYSVGHWLTGLDGKKVYVGKSGEELTCRIAYMQYKKESGAGFKKVKRKSVTKKKK